MCRIVLFSNALSKMQKTRQSPIYKGFDMFFCNACVIPLECEIPVAICSTERIGTEHAKKIFY